MKLRFAMSEMMVIFATGMLWHNVAAAVGVFAFACICAFMRYALEFNEKAKQAEAQKEAVKLLNEQAGELGEALGSLFGIANKKNKMNVH